MERITQILESGESKLHMLWSLQTNSNGGVYLPALIGSRVIVWQLPQAAPMLLLLLLLQVTC
jgi:hypothetical protein